jgi:predicted nucleic acid-binding protein
VSHVVDTSVVLKWVVREDDSEVARAWAGTPLAAPDLVRAELANALWKKVRREEIQPGQARRAFPRALEAVTLVSALPLIERALAVAIELSHPVYDCVFLTLAESLEVRLLTADRRLIQACANTRFSHLLRHLEEQS